MKKFITLATILAVTTTLSGCIEDAPKSGGTKTNESAKAAAAANSISFAAGNAEIDNIKRRLELTSDPALMGYVVLFNDMGQPILYTTVKGKVTSGAKRLTAPIQAWNVDRGEFNGTELDDAPSDEGTWGSSNPYIFFWTTGGQYIQWSGNYLYSDRPLRLDAAPVVTISNGN